MSTGAEERDGGTGSLTTEGDGATTTLQKFNKKLGRLADFIESVPVKLLLFLIGVIPAGPLLAEAIRSSKVGDRLAQRAPLLWVCVLATGLLIGIFVVTYKSTKALRIQEREHSEKVEALYQEQSAKLDSLVRRARFADAMPAVKEGFDHVRDANYAVLQTLYETPKGAAENPLTDATKRAIGDHIEGAITAWAKAFNAIVGKSCRLCIKKVDYDDAGEGPSANLTSFTVSDVCRDNPDDLYQDDKSGDTIGGNTGFREAIRPAGYWLGHDLLEKYKRHEYDNSHWERTRTEIMSQGPPYLSTINWAIRQKVGSGREGEILIGFLCVDTKDPYGLSDEDVALGFALARAIASPLVAVVGMPGSGPGATPKRSGATKRRAAPAVKASTTSRQTRRR